LSSLIYAIFCLFSFHVGSGCLEAEAFKKAISAARKVFDQAKVIGYNFNLLDIGGGFPGFDQPEINFDEVTQTINTSLDELFPDDDDLRIIAEPGRYYATSAYTLAVNVIAKREEVEAEPVEEDKARVMYYINDGVYGSFNCLLYDHAELTPDYLKEVDSKATITSSLWGPTCDGLDCILKNCAMPSLEVGEWLCFRNMGAYTLVAGSTFNGMPRPNVYYYIEDTRWLQMLVMMPSQDSIQLVLKDFDVAKPVPDLSDLQELVVPDVKCCAPEC
ncbi:ornithine decarboxylase, partial [Lingula anatina]|uniref:Ornithine decarboxylase n=1 Tax=Lingula anatina TaxID=7574 RepID=A0A1S3ICK4_LINAN